MTTTCCSVMLFAMSYDDVMGGSLRCGNRLVTEGDYKYEVIQRCGEPQLQELVSVETRYKRLPNSNKSVAVELPVEQWVYDMGRGRFLKILTFKGMRLEKVESGNKQ